MNERAFYTESETTRAIELSCPHCRTVDKYELRWMLCRKRERLPGGVDEEDRKRFAKAQSYMVLLDDMVACKNLRCRRRFEVSGIKTMAFLSAEQEAALPAQRPQAESRPPRPGGRVSLPQPRQGQPSGQPHAGKRKKQKKRERPYIGVWTGRV
jgi:hypothetical protein